MIVEKTAESRPGPTCQSSGTMTGGHVVAHVPKHVLVACVSFVKPYNVRPSVPVRSVPRSFFADFTVTLVPNEEGLVPTADDAGVEADECPPPPQAVKAMPMATSSPPRRILRMVFSLSCWCQRTMSSPDIWGWISHTNA